MHSDHMFIAGMAYVVTVLKPSQYMMVQPIRQKITDELRGALQKHKTEAKSHAVTITELRFDKESAIEVLLNEIRGDGVLPEITGGGEIVPVVERASNHTRCTVQVAGSNAEYSSEVRATAYSHDSQ